MTHQRIQFVMINPTRTERFLVSRKVQVGKDQEKAQSEKDSHSKNRGGSGKKPILTHLAYIANGKKTCYIVQQFHWANKRDVTLRHL